ncbi:hypothetical protein ACQQ2N_03235 [Dokdonella sp. MW10]|uniref:hypothetical protein n=1 Tax=Dokdonella sp. MW10 TaxID=2992926 RepID=UPI003F7DD729
MSKTDRMTQWMMLLGGAVLVLCSGSRALAWLSSGLPSFEMKGVTYTGWVAEFCIVAFGLAGLFLLISAARNLWTWQ